VIMAHIGSFVPAKSATIGPIDAIFTRIGAADNVAGGQSTFMVEMTEAANILHNATSLSVVLIDEIGRGTSTLDGVALAWAAADHLARMNQSFTLFATHYFELTALADNLPQIRNVRLDAVENGNEIIFMHSLKQGPASRSYGLAVAQLAGIPPEVISHARERLHTIADAPLYPPRDVETAQMPLFDNDLSRIKSVLAATDPDELSPRDALELIYRLQAMIDPDRN
jgi:DNA mismatch repair protein MutS